MILLDRDGNEVNIWEVAMRVEHMLVTRHPGLVVVCGEDGYIDLIDLEPLYAETNEVNSGSIDLPIYNPVSTGLRSDEARITLFFSDDQAGLVPVTRSITLSESLIRSSMEELVRGPARGSSLYRTIPDKEITIDVLLDPLSGRLTIELSPGLIQPNGSLQNRVAFNSLLMTASAFNEVKEIIFTIEGEPLESFGDITIDQPLEPQRWKSPVFIPLASGERYYLTIREGATGAEQTAELEDLLQQLMRYCRALPFVSQDLALVDLRVSSDEAEVRLNSNFKELFPEVISENERLQAALVLDAIFMTVFENSRAQRVEIFVENQGWRPPAGYPSLSRFKRQPYFINPEQ